jgi:hypothetical protein
MSQQASDLPRSVRIIAHYRILVGLMAVLGLLAGALLAMLNPLVTSGEALVAFTPPSCPGGGICGGPAFSPGYIPAGDLPASVNIELMPGNLLAVTAAGQPAALVNASARTYIAYAGSLTYMGQPPSVRLLQPAGTVTEPVTAKRLLDDALLGALAGALAGIIAALAAGQTIIDPVTMPRAFGDGAEAVGAGPAGAWAGGAGREGGVSLRQMALDQASRAPDPDRARPEPPP